MKEINAVMRIRTGVVEEAVYGDIEDFSQIGIKIGEPPIPKVAPAIPATRPTANNCNIFCLLYYI